MWVPSNVQTMADAWIWMELASQFASIDNLQQDTTQPPRHVFHIFETSRRIHIDREENDQTTGAHRKENSCS